MLLLCLSVERKLGDSHSRAMVLEKDGPDQEMIKLTINAFKTYNIQTFFFFFPSSKFTTVLSIPSLLISSNILANLSVPSQFWITNTTSPLNYSLQHTNMG